MTYLPSAWIIFCAALLGCIEQGCNSDKEGNGNQDETNSVPGGPTPTPATGHEIKRDETYFPDAIPSRTSGSEVGQWIEGTLTATNKNIPLKLQTVANRNGSQATTNQTDCLTYCVQWCSCTAAVWTESTQTCQLSDVDGVTVERSVDTSTKETKLAIRTTQPSTDRRRMLYGTTTTEPILTTKVWIIPRCDHAIEGMYLNPTNPAVEQEQDYGTPIVEESECQSTCDDRTPTCAAWRVNTITSNGYANTGTKKTCHPTQQSMYLSATPPTTDDNQSAADKVDTSIESTAWTRCPADGVCEAPRYGYFFAGLYANDGYGSEYEVKGENGTRMTQAACDNECECDPECTVWTFRTEKNDSSAVACFHKNDTTELVDAGSSTRFTFVSNLRLGRPKFVKEEEASERASGSTASSTGLIVGAVLGALAVAVLTFVGVRAYKKHKGAGGQDEFENGSVATSSPKSARNKRQAIE